MSKTKIVLTVVGSIVLAIVVYFLILLFQVVFFPVAKTGMAIDMTYKTTKKVLDADKALFNYEFFKQQKADIDSLGRKEKIALDSIKSYKSMLPKARTKWTREDRIELSRLATVYNGIRYQTSDAIALYNARSKMVSRNIFKNNLPVSIGRGLDAKNNL